MTKDGKESSGYCKMQLAWNPK